MTSFPGTSLYLFRLACLAAGAYLIASPCGDWRAMTGKEDLEVQLGQTAGPGGQVLGCVGVVQLPGHELGSPSSSRAERRAPSAPSTGSPASSTILPWSALVTGSMAM